MSPRVIRILVGVFLAGLLYGIGGALRSRDDLRRLHERSAEWCRQYERWAKEPDSYTYFRDTAWIECGP